VEKVMKKEDLIALGLSEEMAAKVEAASTEELKGYIPKTRFDEVNTEKNKLADSVKERDGQLEELKKSTNVDELNKQIEKLQSDNTKKDEKHAAEIKALKIETVLDAALTAAKAKNSKAVKALLDLEGAELDKDGNIKGLSEQLKKLTEADDSKFLFDAAPAQPKFKGANPAESRFEKADGTVDFTKMSYEELAKFMDENPNVEIPEAPIVPAQPAQTQNHS